MQLTQAELDRTKRLLGEATDNDARVRLSWVVKAFEWTLEPPGRPSPADLAAQASDPLDHDGDGAKGGSAKPKRKTTNRKPASRTA